MNSKYKDITNLFIGYDRYQNSGYFISKIYPICKRQLYPHIVSSLSIPYFNQMAQGSVSFSIETKIDVQRK